MKIAPRPIARPLSRILSGCTALAIIAFAPVVPATAEQKSPNQIDEPRPVRAENYEYDEEPGHFYVSCAHARRAGAAPLLRSQRGYWRRLDFDGDGVACEIGEY